MIENIKCETIGKVKLIPNFPQLCNIGRLVTLVPE